MDIAVVHDPRHDDPDHACLIRSVQGRGGPRPYPYQSIGRQSGHRNELGFFATTYALVVDLRDPILRPDDLVDAALASAAQLRSEDDFATLRIAQAH